MTVVEVDQVIGLDLVDDAAGPKPVDVVATLVGRSTQEMVDEREIGLHLAWQRWVLAAVLSLPFWLLFAASTPGALEGLLDAWKERRNRR